jgi:transmembrane sensor
MSERTEAAAATWFVKRQSGSWSDSDQATLEAWIAADTAHRIAYIRLETAWRHSERLKALGAGVPPGVIPARGSWGDVRHFKGLAADSRPPPQSTLDAPEETERQTPVPSKLSSLPASARRRKLAIFSTVASLLLSVSAGIYVYVADPFAGDRYVTPVGGLNNVRLIDGSHVTLNTDTNIRVILSAQERRIDLDRGEAFFQVAKDPSRPFVVYVGDKRVMAVGTQFSVRRESDDVQVVVTEGRVRLSTAPQSLVPALREAAGRKGEDSTARNDPFSAAGSAAPPATLLPAGTVARTSKTQVLVREQTPPEAEDLLAWRNGYVVFRDTTLAAAVEEFNRYNRRKMVIQDPSIASIRIGGNFRSDNIAAFLWLIQNGFPITADQDDERVILKAR